MLHWNGLKGRRISSIDSKLRAKLTGSLCTDSRYPKKQNRGQYSIIHSGGGGWEWLIRNQ